jgi:hypothetical protein
VSQALSIAYTFLLPPPPTLVPHAGSILCIHTHLSPHGRQEPVGAGLAGPREVREDKLSWTAGAEAVEGWQAGSIALDLLFLCQGFQTCSSRGRK